MKLLKKILVGLLIAVVLFVFIGLVFINSLTPTYSGEQELTDLTADVSVYFDAYGIPHIYGETEEDALRALGYVHAQDRLWQMELLRRIAKGRLSAVFGADLVETDKFMLTLGIDEHTNKTMSHLDMDSKTVQLAQAYLDGINAFVDKGPTPVEFYLTGLDKTPFQLEDVYNTIGYMAFSFAMGHKTDPLLTELRNKLGDGYIQDLAITSDTSSTWIKNYKLPSRDSVAASVTAQVTQLLDKLPVPQFVGSNSWVLAPEKTKNGKVILANDPHIGFAQPSVWYEAHVTAKNYEKYGYHIAGIPFPLLGHDRNLAYGLTMFQNDDINFYFEEYHPSDSAKYKTAAGYASFEIVTKTIKVKDGEDVEFQFKKTKNGPLLNGVSKQLYSERPIAVSWVYTQLDNQVMDALYGMTHATNMEEFKKALPKIHAPGLNIMYGDAEGNVAWWATAKLFEMPDSLSTKFILNGAVANEQPLNYLDFSENPSAVNPPWQYVYSANNQPDSVNGKLVPGYYLPENRAKRIVSLLEGKDKWDKSAAAKMILDVTSSVNPSLVAEMIRLVDIKELSPEQTKQMDLLKNWDGSYQLNSTAATLYHRAEYRVVKNIFEDEMGEGLFQDFLKTHLFKRQIAHIAKKDHSPWWDNINTPDVKEDKASIATVSFKEAWESLVEDFGPNPDEWTWDKVHTVEHEHPIGQVESLRTYFNVGPFPIHGSREVINNLSFGYDDTGFYKVTVGPSTRRIIDFSDIENSISILPTGQSGNPLSKHYKDQALLYVNGEFRKMMMNKEEIIRESTDILLFAPK